jgi:hypothetical protein
MNISELFEKNIKYSNRALKYILTFKRNNIFKIAITFLIFNILNKF